MRAPSSTILGSLPLLQLQPRAPVAAVAPLPEKTRFDRELSAELDSLLRRSQGTTDGENIGLARLLDAAITSQKIALNSIVSVSISRDDDVAHDRGAVDEYLDNNVEILDAYNHFVNKIDDFKKHVDSLIRMVPRLVEDINTNGSAKKSSGVAATSALDLLESCHQDIEKECKAMEKGNPAGSSCLRKLLRQKLVGHESELSEIMCGSKAMALMSCTFLELGLSFDSKRGLPTLRQSQPTSFSWLRLLQELLAKQAEGSADQKKLHRRRSGSSLKLMMTELQQTVSAARELKEQMKVKREKQEMKSAVERLKRSCKELEDGLAFIEQRVKDLYKSLIDVRMALLGILSQANNF